MGPDLHFNELAFLARVDPEVFERRRREAIAGFLDQCGPRRRQLEALQADIDTRRMQAATPEEAVVAISALMCDSLASLGGEMVKLCRNLNDLRKAEAQPRRTGQDPSAVCRRPALAVSSRSSSG